MPLSYLCINLYRKTNHLARFYSLIYVWKCFFFMINRVVKEQIAIKNSAFKSLSKAMNEKWRLRFNV